MKRQSSLCFISEIIQLVSIELNMRVLEAKNTCRVNFMLVIAISVAY
jgi:hypothetical protein